VCGNSHEPRHRSRKRTKRSAQLVRAADMPVMVGPEAVF
jgi:hypothetical protein